MADQFRAAFVGSAVEPLNNLAAVLNDLGGVVLGRLDTSRFEGASAVIDGYGFIFVSPRFSGRMLFTLAHELGHLLAHHRQPRSALFEVASQIGNLRHRNKKEAFVDAFASALLMPQEGVAIALREIRRALNVGRDALGDVEILYLAILYGVSFEVAARRCEQLELLPDGGAYSLSDHVKHVYGSAERLATSAGLPARARIDFPRVSQNLIDAAISRIDDGEVSIGWVTDRLGCSLSDLYSARAVRGEPRGNRA
jgi:Zn-dependent peptidase ImmA (M78 family)